MNIRELEEADLNTVSSICIKAFMESVAPSLSREGIEVFRKTASVDSFSNRMQGDNAILVHEEKGCINGVIELREGHHLAMLFVDPDFQRKGVGRKLVSAIFPYTTSAKITVRASLNSVPAYLKYGFIYVGKPDEMFGLKYQPMELELSKALHQTNY